MKHGYLLKQKGLVLLSGFIMAIFFIWCNGYAEINVQQRAPATSMEQPESTDIAAGSAESKSTYVEPQLEAIVTGDWFCPKQDHPNGGLKCWGSPGGFENMAGCQSMATNKCTTVEVSASPLAHDCRCIP